MDFWAKASEEDFFVMLAKQQQMEEADAKAANARSEVTILIDKYPPLTG